MTRPGVINIPHKVGPAAWLKCWLIMARRTGFFGVNESLSRRQRAVYLAAATARGWGQYGIRSSPNPIFYRRKQWKRDVGSHVVKLHDAGTDGRARLYPGFNSARYATVVCLVRRRTKQRHVVINAHLIPQQKVDADWRDNVRASSFAMIAALVRDYTDNGAVVWVMGDMNYYPTFPLGRRFHWLRGEGIDKLGVSLPAGMTLGEVDVRIVPAPTDHQHGVVAEVQLLRRDKVRLT